MRIYLTGIKKPTLKYRQLALQDLITITTVYNVVVRGIIVQCRAYADKVVFIYNSEEVGRHNRSFNRGKTVYNPEHYFPILARKPGALRNGAPFIDMEIP